nr:hypothetical protein [Burkholderia anthina]
MKNPAAIVLQKNPYVRLIAAAQEHAAAIERMRHDSPAPCIDFGAVQIAHHARIYRPLRKPNVEMLALDPH